MKTINIRKEEYDYAFHRISFHINKHVKNIRCLFYWTSKDLITHHLYLKGESQNLSITIRFTGKFLIPDDETLCCGKRWGITLPKEYDISIFMYEVIFRQTGKHPFSPVKTLLGISPKKERARCHKYRSRIKRLILSLTSEIKSGSLDHHTAATHFSSSAGLTIEASLRYFSRCAMNI